MNQWFVDVNKKIPARGNKSLKELMLGVVSEKTVSFIPENFERIYTHWISNLHDWCISRQIWFGHRIPVWYKDNEIVVSLESPGKDYTQDEDTLDTWFSSGLWTFSTLGWPEKTKDLETYHPTAILETGYDILPFWVARMILMSTYLLGTVPFKTVYFHGLVRNPDGSKMSKSSGAIDPLLMCDKYGTDAVRMALIIGTGPGSDSKMSEDKIRAYKNFSNKLWNIARYVLTATEGIKFSETNGPELSPSDDKTVAELETLFGDVKTDMENFRYHLVAEKLYHYVWHTFADVYIEESKKKIAEGGTVAESAKWTLLYILTQSLRALHPFAPFVTEEIWSDMPIVGKKMLLIETTPI